MHEVPSDVEDRARGGEHQRAKGRGKNASIWLRKSGGWRCLGPSRRTSGAAAWVGVLPRHASERLRIRISDRRHPPRRAETVRSPALQRRRPYDAAKSTILKALSQRLSARRTTVTASAWCSVWRDPVINRWLRGKRESTRHPAERGPVSSGRRHAARVQPKYSASDVYEPGTLCARRAQDPRGEKIA